MTITTTLDSISDELFDCLSETEFLRTLTSTFGAVAHNTGLDELTATTAFILIGRQADDIYKRISETLENLDDLDAGVSISDQFGQ